jgi:hypothetical protein
MDTRKPNDCGKRLMLTASTAATSEETYRDKRLFCFYQQFGFNEEMRIPKTWKAGTLGLRKRVVRIGDYSLKFLTVGSPRLTFHGEHSDDWDEVFFFVDAEGLVFDLISSCLDEEDQDAGFKLSIADAE